MLDDDGVLCCAPYNSASALLVRPFSEELIWDRVATAGGKDFEMLMRAMIQRTGGAFKYYVIRLSCLVHERPCKTVHFICVFTLDLMSKRRLVMSKLLNM